MPGRTCSLCVPCLLRSHSRRLRQRRRPVCPSPSGRLGIRQSSSSRQETIGPLATRSLTLTLQLSLPLHHRRSRLHQQLHPRLEALNTFEPLSSRSIIIQTACGRGGFCLLHQCIDHDLPFPVVCLRNLSLKFNDSKSMHLLILSSA